MTTGTFEAVLSGLYTETWMKIVAHGKPPLMSAREPSLPRQALIRRGALAAVLAVVAFFTVTQLRNELLIRRQLRVPSLRLQELAYSLRQQEHRATAMEQQIATLREQLQRYEQAASEGQAQLASLRAQLQSLEALAGLTAVTGPGVVIRLDDSRRPLRPGQNPNEVILHNYDVATVVNELWVAGAEAIAINGQRMIATTPIRSVATTMMVNTKRITPPITIEAIGDPDKLAARVLQPGGYLGLLKTFDFPVKVTQVAELTIPAYRGPLRFKYIRSTAPPPAK